MFSRGVPPEYANEIEQWALRGRFAPKRQRTSLGQTLKGLLITIPFWLGLGFAYWLLNGIAAQQAEQAARDVGAIFLGYQVIFGPVLLFICLGIVVCAGYLLAEDPYDGRHAAATHLWSPIFLPGFYCKAIVASIRLQSMTADDFLMRLRKRDLRIRLGFVALAAIAGVVITIGETGAFFVVGPRGITDQKFWGEATRRATPLSEVVSVDKDCYLSGGRSKQWTLYYRLNLHDGRNYNIASLPMLRGDRLTELEAIDSGLPAKVPRIPAVNLRQRLDRCVGTAAGITPDAHARLIRLLDRGVTR
jgi:hypothetical protein